MTTCRIWKRKVISMSSSSRKTHYRRQGKGGEDEYTKVFKGTYKSYDKHPLNEYDNIIAGVCYIFGWIASIIVLLAVKPTSPWLRFHAIQALFLSAALWAVAIFLNFIGIAFYLLPVRFCFGYLLNLLILAIFVYLIVIAVFCFLEKDHRVPVLGDWVEKNWV
jgi:uncharacterized membrane protein